MAPSEEATLASLLSLEELGLVRRTNFDNDPGPVLWQMTVTGRDRLVFGKQLVGHDDVCCVRPDVDITHRTDFELILLWEAEGWQLQRVARLQQLRGKPAYKPGDARIYCSAGGVMHRGYLVALLSANEKTSLCRMAWRAKPMRIC